MMLKAIIILICGAAIGAAMGYFGKCSNGQCPLTANPVRGAVWGFFLALIMVYPLIMNAFRKPVPESPNVIHIKSPEELQAIISKPGSVCLIDFYADWCGPCRALAPTINKLADDFKDKASIIKINVDDFSSLAQQYGANSIPTVIITSEGKQVEKMVGINSYNTYAQLLKEYKKQD